MDAGNRLGYINELLFNWILVGDERTTNISYRQSCTLCSMPEALIYASNEPKSYSWYDLGDCRDSHNKHALRVYYGWIFLRLFIYVMVVSATVRYGTSVSHISLPQTSVSVDSWVEKEKSKNYHNWTSSASYDVCTPAFLIYAVWLWLNLRKMNVWLNQRGEAWGRNCA